MRVRRYNYNNNKHIDAVFVKYEVNFDLTHPSRFTHCHPLVRLLHQFSLRRSVGQIYYSKLHFDPSKTFAQESKAEYYTVKEAMELFNLALPMSTTFCSSPDPRALRLFPKS